jgi:hypothetical protein
LSLLVKAVELLLNQYWVTLVLRSLLGRPWAALLLLSLHQKGDLLLFLLLGPHHLGLSQRLDNLEFLNAFHNVSIRDDVLGGELSSLLSLGFLLDEVFLILGLFDGGLKLLPLALAVTLRCLHGMNTEWPK